MTVRCQTIVGGLLALLLLTTLCVIPARGQSPDPEKEVSAFRASVARAGAQLAAEGPGTFEIQQGASGSTDTSDDWARLQNLYAGTKLVVSRSGSWDLKVRLQAVGIDTLRVQTAEGGSLSLHRDEVLAVYRDHSLTTGRWVGLGLLTGVAAGLMLGVIGSSGCGDCEMAGVAMVVGPVMGAAAGSLGGFFASGIANRNPPRLIYRAPPPPDRTALPIVR